MKFVAECSVMAWYGLLTCLHNVQGTQLVVAFLWIFCLLPGVRLRLNTVKLIVLTHTGKLMGPQMHVNDLPSCTLSLFWTFPALIIDWISVCTLLFWFYAVFVYSCCCTSLQVLVVTFLGRVWEFAPWAWIEFAANSHPPLEFCNVNLGLRLSLILICLLCIKYTHQIVGALIHRFSATLCGVS